MNKQSKAYNHFQPYVELGYGMADMFLVKKKSYTDVVYGEPYFSSDSKYFVYSDLKPDNTGFMAINKPIPCNKKLMILDTDGCLDVKYDDLELLERSILNYYSELLSEKTEILAYAFNFGFRLRLGVLGDIVLSNIIIQAKINMFYGSTNKNRINISNSNIICLRVIQNYIIRYFNERGIDFKKYNNDTVNYYNEIISMSLPSFLSHSMLRYLSEITVCISMCKNDSKNLFSGLEMLHSISMKNQDYLLAFWALNNQILAPTSDKIKQILKERKNILMNLINGEVPVNADLYGSLWEYHEFNISYNKNVFYKALRNENNYLKTRNYDLLKSVIWVCKNDINSLNEIISLLRESNYESIDVFELSDLIINEVDTSNTISKTLEGFIISQANRHYYKNNYYKSLFYIKKYLKYGNLETPSISKMLAYIYDYFGENEKSKIYNAKYNETIKNEYVDIEPLEFDPILVWDGDKERIRLKIDKVFCYKSDKMEDYTKVIRKIIMPDHAPRAPIYVGDVIGKVEYYLDTKIIGYVNIVASESTVHDRAAAMLRFKNFLSRSERTSDE